MFLYHIRLYSEFAHVLEEKILTISGVTHCECVNVEEAPSEAAPSFPKHVDHTLLIVMLHCDDEAADKMKRLLAAADTLGMVFRVYRYQCTQELRIV